MLLPSPTQATRTFSRSGFTSAMVSTSLMTWQGWWSSDRAFTTGMEA